MSPPRSWVDGGRPLVADASVWINIIAGGQATAILHALARPPILPRIVLGELERGRNKGRATAERMAELIEMGLVEVARSSCRCRSHLHKSDRRTDQRDPRRRRGCDFGARLPDRRHRNDR